MPNNAASIKLSFSGLFGMRPLHLTLIVLNFVLVFAKPVPDSLFTTDAEDNRRPKWFYGLLTPISPFLLYLARSLLCIISDSCLHLQVVVSEEGSLDGIPATDVFVS